MSPQKPNNAQIIKNISVCYDTHYHYMRMFSNFYHRTTAELHHGVFNRGELAQLAPDKVPVPDVRRPDYFKSMTQLFAHTKEGRDWKKNHTKSDAIIIAPHGVILKKEQRNYRDLLHERTIIISIHL